MIWLTTCVRTVSRDLAGFVFVVILSSGMLRTSNGRAQDSEVSPSQDLRPIYLEYALGHEGDAELGRNLFNDREKTLCINCHQLTGMEKSGPNLDGIASKYSFEQLVRQVLYPSEFMTHGFEQVTVLTNAGNLIAGRVERANRQEVRLIDADGKQHNIQMQDVEQLQELSVSLMPADLQKNLTTQEFADLMAYLKTLKFSIHEGLAAGGTKVAIPHLNPSIKIEPIHPPELSFENPVWCGGLPGTESDLLVIEHMASRIWRLVRSGGTIRKELFLDLKDQTHTSANQGLMCMTFHPHFVDNRRYFLEYEVRESGEVKTTVAERKAAEDGLTDSGMASRRLLDVFQPAFNHNGGCIDFGPDGMLYIAFGDGGPQMDPNGYAQNPRVLLGSMLRIDVDRQQQGLPYAIPEDNPFWEAHRQDAAIRAETWAFGLREPWRFSFDSRTGELYVGDVGQNSYEELCLVRRGENHGWNVREAFSEFSDEYARPGEVYAEPLFAYQHGLGFSITGGYVYHGTQSPSFDGVYIFGDYNTRLIWGLKQSEGVLKSVVELGTAPNGIASFGVDQQGEIYLVTYQGTIYHVNLEGSVYPHER